MNLAIEILPAVLIGSPVVWLAWCFYRDLVVLPIRRAWRKRHVAKFDREMTAAIKPTLAKTRDIRIHAREMIKAASKMGKLDMLRKMNALQLQQDPTHPLARQLAKLLESER